MTDPSAPPAARQDAAVRFASEAAPLLDSLLRRARGLSRTNADAEDLLQDTLLNAFAGFHTFREGTDFRAWLFRILHNRWVSTYRLRQRRPAEVSVDGVTESELAASAARQPSAARSAEAEALDGLPNQQIQSAMATLPENFRAALFYAEVQGHTFTETAAILDVPRGTVMSRVSRGRARLRVALADTVNVA